MMQSPLTVSDLFQAYYDCRKTKRNTWNALEFEQNLERNLMDLYYELVQKTYIPGRSIMFVVTHPKPREIWAANFRDRVVHHVLYNKYANYFHNRFIHDSYACIPNKGTLKAANRVTHFIRSVTHNHTTKAWYLKADISNFFVSINKKILNQLLLKHISHPWWVWLTKTILHKDPKENVYIKSNKQLLQQVPLHKSLLNASDGYGLPIGNLSSQFFANIYLNELDQYAKHKLKVKYYVRYVDDIVMFHKCPKTLNSYYTNMINFVKSNLQLNFHPNKKQINKIQYGVPFVGYVIRPWAKYLRRTTIQNLYKRSDNLEDFKSLQASVNSYFGFMRHANLYNERKKAAMYLSKRGCWFDGKLTKLKGMYPCTYA